MPLTTGIGALNTQFGSALKELYIGPLEDSIVRHGPLISRIEKTAKDVSGRYAYIPIMSKRNPGVGSRKDTNGSGPKLPEAGNPTFTHATFIMTYSYGRSSVSGPVIRASKNDAGAFATALDTCMQELMETLPEDLARQSWSYGHGRRATLAANMAAGTTFSAQARSIFNLKIGDRICFATASSGALVGTLPNGTEVTDISFYASSTTHTVTVADATGSTVTATTDVVYGGKDSAGLTAEDISRAQEMYGIPALIDDGAVGADENVAAVAGEFVVNALTLGGIDRTTAAGSFWRSHVLHNSGTLRDLTNALLQKAFLTVTTFGGAKPQDIDIYCPPDVWATLGLLHIGDRRYNDYQETIEGGWVALKYNGRPILADVDCQANTMWFVNMKDIMLLTQSGYELMDDDGNVLKKVTNRDAYEFTLYRDIQLGARKLKSSLVIKDIAVTTTISGAR